MSDNPSVVYDAAKSQDWRRVSELCASNARFASHAGSDGMTALHLACQHQCRDAEVVETLVEADPQVLLVRENHGMVPLHYACRFQASSEIVGLLLHLHPRLGHAAVSKRDRKGRTPLYYAEQHGAPTDVIAMLREINPDETSERVEGDELQEGNGAGSGMDTHTAGPVENFGRQTSFAREFFNSSTGSGLDVMGDREVAAALAASSSLHDPSLRSDSPKSWMEDVRIQQQQAEGEGEAEAEAEADWKQSWAGESDTEQAMSPTDGLNEFQSHEILEQYRIMAQHEAYVRLKKTTGFDMEEYEKRPPTVGKMEDGYRKKLLTPRLPEPRRVYFTSNVPPLQEPVLPSIKPKKTHCENMKEIAPEVALGVLIGFEDEVPPGEHSLQCLGCGSKLRVKRKAMFASCPNCSAESPVLSPRQQVHV